MYVDTIFKDGTTYYGVSGFTNLFVCDTSATTVAKSITNFPNGLSSTDSNIIIRVLFTNGHHTTSTSSFSSFTLSIRHQDGTYFNGSTTVTNYAVYNPSNSSALKVHNVATNSLGVGTDKQISLSPNTCLDLRFDTTNSRFVVVGNPLVVFYSSGLRIYADGSVDGGNIGDVKAISTVDIPYGWLECNGQSVSSTTYSQLYNYFNTQKYDGTNTLLSRYGGNSSNFNLPDYREVALVGVGTNAKDTTIADHDIYTVGEFKDDCLQRIQGYFNLGQKYGSSYGLGPVETNGVFQAGGSLYSEYSVAQIQNSGASMVYFDSNAVTRSGTITHGKQKGVKYLIKAL